MFKRLHFWIFCHRTLVDCLPQLNSWNNHWSYNLLLFHNFFEHNRLLYFANTQHRGNSCCLHCHNHLFSHHRSVTIRKAAKAKPTETMSPIYKLGTTVGLGRKIPSRLGFTFKVAYRNLVRRKSVTLQAIICLTVVLTLTTVTIVGGMIADQTTTSYVERAYVKT